MIQAGVLENPKVDAIFAFHNHPGFMEGTVLIRFGTALSGNTDVVITINGKGGHAATSEHNIDPILVAAMVVQMFSVISQQLSLPEAPVVMRITELNSSGGSRNIVPNNAVLAGTIRSMSVQQREGAKQRITEMAESIAHAHGAEAVVEFKDLIPPTINTDAETEYVFKTAVDFLGKDRVQEKRFPARASEDFAFYLEKTPGCYFFIGNGIDSPSCHSSHYDFNDAILPVAAELLCRLAMDYLNKIDIL